MASGNQVNKNQLVDAPLVKRQKVGTGKSIASTTSSRRRQAPTHVTTNQKEVAAKPSEAQVPADENMDFTKEEVVDALLNEQFKKKSQFNIKAKQDLEMKYIKKLKTCIKWFQKSLEDRTTEKDNLCNMLDSSKRNSAEAEAATKKKEEDFKATIVKLEANIASLKSSLANEVSDKLDALDRHQREKEAKIILEKNQESLEKELQRFKNKVSSFKEKVKTQEDTYKRLQEYNTKLQNDLKSATDSNLLVEREKRVILENHSSLLGYYNMLQAGFTSAKDSCDEVFKQREAAVKEVGILTGELQQVREDKERQLLLVQQLNYKLARFKESIGCTTAEVNQLSIKSSALEETCSSQRDQISLLQHQLAAANEKLKMAENQLVDGEKLRKKLHNTILELKGNIRVFCRVRPPLLLDDGPGAEPTVTYPTSPELAGRGIDLIQRGQKYSFTFDKVFAPDVSQQEVFMEISQLVQSALDGFKVCIFAYGQTGSGKTYTMIGSPKAPIQKGLIPRSLEQVFQTSEALAAQGWKYKMQASMLEIYNESIQDLLAIKSNAAKDGGKKQPQCKISHDAKGNTCVSDLTIFDVCNIGEVSTLLQTATGNRSVGRTDMNEASSRSHFVFILRIHGVNERTKDQVQGVLNLIDLAGSERLSRSGATGDRLTETKAINKSLSSLSDVICALLKKEDHIRFRDTKLTNLLQPFLGGDSKTLMFVNVSPDPSSISESLCSLRFAARVNSCEIGIPRIQTVRPLDSRLSCG